MPAKSESLNRIAKLKAEIARLEGESLKALKAKREALVAEIATVDEQIAALVGRGSVGPSPKMQVPRELVEAIPSQSREVVLAKEADNTETIYKDELKPSKNQGGEEAESELSQSASAKAQNDLSLLRPDSIAFPPRIPVLSKNPCPVGFCYPIAASLISEALLGVRMFDQFTLRYSNRTPIFTMTQPLRGFPMLRIAFTNYPEYRPRPGATSKFQGGERWALEILAAPYDHRDFIQNTIVEKALPLLREWLTGPDQPTSDIRRVTKACWYVVETGLVKWIDEEQEDEYR